MTEKEKCINGLMYNPMNDKELTDERNRAKQLCYDYNNSRPGDNVARNNILNELLNKLGKNVYIENNFYCDYGYNITIGDNFYSNHNLTVLDCQEVIIGNNVFIGPNCGIYTAGHPIDKEQRNMGLEYAKKIHIGNDVWIGGNVCILPGVIIGDNVVIGAGSVVTKDIPSNVIAYGNPCRVVKNINKN